MLESYLIFIYLLSFFKPVNSETFRRDTPFKNCAVYNIMSEGSAACTWVRLSLSDTVMTEWRLE